MIALKWLGYKLVDINNINILPSFAGVYKLALLYSSTNKYAPFYVGQTVNLHDRTIQHASQSELNKGIKDNFINYSIYINYAEVKLQSDRDAVEVALYNRYNPSCNDPKVLPNITPAVVSSFN